MDSVPGRTRDKASREVNDMEECQLFPMGSKDSAVSGSKSEELWPLSPVQEIRSRGFQLFDEQPNVRQPQPGEQLHVGDHLAQSVVSITTTN